MSLSPTNSATVVVYAGRPMLARRLFYGVLLILVLLIFVAHLPYTWQRATMLSEAESITALGVSPNLLPIYEITLRIIFVSTFTVVSLLLFSARSEEPIAYLGSIMLLSTGFLYGASAPRDHALWIASVAIFALAETTQALFLYSFPDGQYLPSWFNRLAIPLYLFRFIIWGNIFLTRGSQGAVEIALFILLLLLGFISLLYRYRNLSTPTQRQQMKWLGIGMVMTVVLVAPSIYLLSVNSIVSPTKNLPIYLLVRTGRDLAMLSLPVMIAFSIMRYRLWDIDLTVNRSIVGAGVTLVLVIIFVAGFLLLQGLSSAILGADNSAVAVALAGIVAGAAFNPVHKRVRTLIDRRLYNFRFDLNQLRNVEEQKTAPSQRVVPLKGMVGSSIDGYELVDLLGRGGMGEVYKAKRDGRTVALKMLRDDVFKRHPDMLVRFEREAAVLNDLRHPRIVSIVETNTKGHPPYLALEYLEGETLSAFLREYGALPLNTFRQLADEIAEVIDYVHARGIVHRDIKASNIMLRSSVGTAKALDPVLMDFGIARASDASDLTLSGKEAIGTIDYMAPEQITAASNVTQTADVYALGVLLYEMLTGQRPFSGRPTHVLFAHLHQPPPDPRTIRPDIPEGLSKVVLRALEKNPTERFESMTELRESLRAA